MRVPIEYLIVFIFFIFWEFIMLTFLWLVVEGDRA